MKDIIKLTFAPLTSLFIFVLGSGLFTTLLSVRLHHEGSHALLIGAVTGAYYAGLAYGSFNIERFIIRVGHIRAFAAFASFLSTVSLIQGLILNPYAWIFLRFLGGFATAGIFIVIESWLLCVGNKNTRGQVLALYMISLYGAQALGQFMINFGDPNTLLLFAITAMLSSLSVIPLSLTKARSPEISEPSTLNFIKLFHASASGLISSFSSGLVLGAIYGLLPLYIMQKTADTSDVAMYMALTIFGGMFLQYPVGKISDYIERRLILIGLAVLTIILSIATITSFNYPYLAYVALFFVGGVTFTMYPISITHTCDSLDQNDIVSGTQGILLAYSIGASIGPFIAPLFMHYAGPNGLFIYFIVICASLTLFLMWRKASVAPTEHEEHFVVMPQTTPITAELDPRTDEE